MAALAANFIVDGQIPDWTVETPVAASRSGDSSTPATISWQVFIGQEGGQLFFRVDVTNLEAATLTVSATVDNPVIVGQTVALVGAAKSSGTITAYQWTQTSGPAVTLANPTQAATTFVAPPVTAPTSLTFKLEVADSNSKTASTTVSTTVKPVDTLTVSTTVDNPTLPEQTVTLVGVAKSSGTVTSYEWSQIPGSRNSPSPTPIKRRPHFIAPKVTQSTSSLAFKLQVADSNGQTISTKANTTVKPAPTLTVSATATSPVTSGQTVSLAGAARTPAAR